MQTLGHQGIDEHLFLLLSLYTVTIFIYALLFIYSLKMSARIGVKCIWAITCNLDHIAAMAETLNTDGA